ncbi:MAG: ergothioneine biosynthesis protein EgtB [Bacteroidetes bacterium]|nr:MAG: ergothioneine biosynthesis protein EgtB [Bacteroidota bacterium]
MQVIPPIISETLSERVRRVRTATETLIGRLRPEDCVVQPVVDVSPPKWHAGHTTWFFEQFLLKDYVKDYPVFHPRYAYLFNSYYEGAGERVQRAYRGNMTRPGVDEILAYRAHVNEHLAAYLDNGREKSEREQFILELGLQHEQQHQELLQYDIKYILGHNPLFPAYIEGQPVASASPVGEVYEGFDAELCSIGFQGPGFHFDNEEGQHRVFLEPFEILNRLITNGEYLEFIEAGGYRNYRYWLDEGWKWVNAQGIGSPMYWFQIEGAWYAYTLHGLHKLDLAAPVTHVSYYEADAFAKWKGKRLPTEFEWEKACKTLSPDIHPNANFAEKGCFGPAAQQNGNPQLYGDVWEWTQSAYLPYPYYTAEDSAIGEYNGKFMVNQMVLRGGSCATPRDHIRPTYRNFFHPHLQWFFNGIRLAASR